MWSRIIICEYVVLQWAMVQSLLRWANHCLLHWKSHIFYYLISRIQILIVFCDELRAWQFVWRDEWRHSRVVWLDLHREHQRYAPFILAIRLIQLFACVFWFAFYCVSFCMMSLMKHNNRTNTSYVIIPTNFKCFDFSIVCKTFTNWSIEWIGDRCAPKRNRHNNNRWHRS
jgi:hypothetical protein